MQHAALGQPPVARDPPEPVRLRERPRGSSSPAATAASLRDGDGDAFGRGGLRVKEAVYVPVTGRSTTSALPFVPKDVGPTRFAPSGLITDTFAPQHEEPPIVTPLRKTVRCWPCPRT